MFTTLIVQPIFNLLVLIYALLPGHDFGVAIIIFTVVVRLALWPLLKRQLHHAKAMRQLQPELKRIKQAAKGDKQKESALMMELYKERQINPFATLGLTLLQFPVLIGLYLGLRKLIDDPQQLIHFSYPAVRNLSWLKEISGDISKFDATFLGFIDLKRPALTLKNVWYIPGLVLVAGSAISQYFQSKQLLPSGKDQRSIRQILKDASGGKQADQSEMQAATGRFTATMIPLLIFFFTLRIASALSLYWFVGSLVALWQQSRVLQDDETEMETIADKPTAKTASASPKEILEGEVVAPKQNTPKPKTAKKSGKAKRRKR